MLAEFGLIVLVLFILLFTGLPVAYCFALTSMFGVLSMGLDTSMLTSVPYQTIDSFPLLAIAFFVLAGDLMTVGGLSKRLVDFANLLVGKIRGGLTHVVVVACVFFGALSGSSVATVAAIGSIMIKEMEKTGFQKKFSVAVVCAAGYLGVLIPPSIPGITYAVASGVSVGAIFLATATPGLLIAASYMVVNYWYAPKFVDQEQVLESRSNLDVSKVCIGAIPALFMPVLILGGIYGGIFTPTEAAAVACVYSLIVGFALKTIKIDKVLYEVLRRSAVSSAVLLVLISLVGILGRIFTMVELPQAVCTGVLSLTTSKIVILLIINFILLIAGMLCETNTAILLFTPIFLPLATHIGIDPVHFGAIMVTNLAIGMITPPYAANVFVGARISGLSFGEIIRYIYPYLAASLVCLVLITYIPEISMWLPNLVLK